MNKGLSVFGSEKIQFSILLVRQIEALGGNFKTTIMSSRLMLEFRIYPQGESLRMMTNMC